MAKPPIEPDPDPLEELRDATSVRIRNLRMSAASAENKQVLSELDVFDAVMQRARSTVQIESIHVDLDYLELAHLL